MSNNKDKRRPIILDFNYKIQEPPISHLRLTARRKHRHYVTIQPVVYLMSDYYLFTDGSVNTQTKIGYGAYLIVTADEVSLPLEKLRERINVHSFTETSSTKLELQTLLWALSDQPEDTEHLTIYTDSQNIINLAERRARFEAHHYHSKRGLPLRNTELYKAYFRSTDPLNFELLKVKGHQSTRKRNQIDQLFALVDKASRKARQARQ